MKVVATISAFNEEIAIGSVIARTKPYVDDVVIDDGSHDFTSSVVRSMGVTVLCHEVNSGKGLALRTIFAWGIEHDVDILVTLDGDGQHNPYEIPDIVAPILEGNADIVNGARFLKGHNDVPAYRRLGQDV